MRQHAHVQTLVTIGGSMFPFVPAGSVVTLERSAVDDLAPGDIVAFVGADGQPVAHRFLGFEADLQGQRRLVVAADQSGQPEAVPAHAYIGRVDQVRFRRLMYRTRGPSGHLMSTIAMRHRRCHRLLSFAIRRLVGKAAPPNAD